MGRWLRWLALAGLIATGLVWFFSDEPLETGVVAWQQWHQERADRVAPGRLWWLGLDAPAGTDPTVAGRDWLQRWRRSMVAGVVPPGDDLERPWRDHRLELPPADAVGRLLSCRDATEAGCERIGTVVESGRILIDRYRQWPLDEPLELSARDLALNPPYPVLVKAERLARLDGLQRLLDGEESVARTLIEMDLDRARDLLTRSESLMMMVIAIRLLADQVDWLLDLQTAGLLERDWLVDRLDPLEDTEGILEQVMRGEFGLALEGLDWLEARQGRGVLDGPDRWLMRLFHRPGMTRNALYEHYAWAASLAEARELSAAVAGRAPIPMSEPSLRNHASYLNLARMPRGEDFMPYVARLHDLDARLILARAWLEHSIEADEDLRVLVRLNPYGWRYGVELDEARGELCMAGPLPDDAGLRCITLQP